MRIMKHELKKIGICFLGFLVISSLSHLVGQPPPGGSSSSTGGGFNLGVKAGAVYHNFTNQPPHMAGKLGYSIGALGKLNLSSSLAIQVEAAYFQQGGKYLMFKDDTRFGVPFSFVSKNVKDASVTLHNVSIPVQAKLTLSSSPAVPKVLIGPYLDYTFYATENYWRTGEIEDNIYGTAIGNDIVTDLYEKLQFGVIAGVEFELETNSNFIVLFGISYKYGITPARKAYSYIDYYAVNESFNTNAASVTIGIQF